MYPCILVFDANESLPTGEEYEGEKISRETISYEATKSVLLPFVPRKGMHIAGIIEVADQDRVWFKDPITDIEENDWGYSIDLVCWDCQKNAFVCRFISFSIAAPHESTPEALEKLYPGWTFTRTGGSYGRGKN